MLELITDLEEIVASGKSIDGFKQLLPKTIIPAPLYWQTVMVYLGFQLLSAEIENHAGIKNKDVIENLVNMTNHVAAILDISINAGSKS